MHIPRISAFTAAPNEATRVKIFTYVGTGFELHIYMQFTFSAAPVICVEHEKYKLATIFISFSPFSHPEVRFE